MLSLNIPGDKSITHRALLLGALANGQTVIDNALLAEDTLATQYALTNMGVSIESHHQQIKINGVGLQGFTAPKKIIDCGNSGTTMRLLAGILAAQNFNATLIGDHSLQSRPMRRIVNPLTLMGADIKAQTNGCAPLTINPVATLKDIYYDMPKASAQIKSCLLLASLCAQVNTQLVQPDFCRDHTERMLQLMGCDIYVNDKHITLPANNQLNATAIQVPGDFSSAIFFIVAASIIPNAKLHLKHIGVNPTRIGALHVLQNMGARIRLLNQHEISNEPVADIIVESSTLHGINMTSTAIATLIDDIPMIAIAAACAQGVTVIKGAQELRVKECDRIHALVTGLNTLGIKATELSDGLVIHGGQIQGGSVNSYDDHRIAMAFMIADCVASSKVIVNSTQCINTSFPNFVKQLSDCEAAWLSL